MTLDAPGEVDRGKWYGAFFAGGGLVGALGAASCCLVPFGLFGLGIGGAWIANLTALAPYQPWFVGLAVVMLGGGFAYARREKRRCAGGYCARPRSHTLLMASLWVASVMVAAAAVFPFAAPLLLGG